MDFLRAGLTYMFGVRLHEGTLTFGFWLIAPFGWEPVLWLMSRLVVHAARQLVSQYREQTALIVHQLISISPQNRRRGKRVND